MDLRAKVDESSELEIGGLCVRPRFFYRGGNDKWRPVAMTRLGVLEQVAGAPAISFDPDVVGTVAREALSFLVGRDYCDLAAAAERGYRDLGGAAQAHVVAIGRRLLGCYDDPQPDLSVDPKTVSFMGGQCVGVGYIVEYEFTTTRFPGSINSGSNTLVGPIVGFEVRTDTGNPNLEALWIVHNGGASELFVVNTSLEGAADDFESYYFTSIERADSQPDSCGDPPDGGIYPPGTDLGDPVAPGGQIGPKQVITLTLQDGQNSFDTGIEVKEITWNPDDNIVVDLDGLGRFKISPDGVIEQDDTTALDKSPGYDELLDEVEQTKTELDASFDIDVTGFSCFAPPFNINFTGTGISGMMQSIGSMFQGLYISNLERCPNPNAAAQLAPRVQIASGTSDGVTVITQAIASNVVQVQLEITNLPPSLRVFKLSGSQSEGRFGNWAVGTVEGGEVVVPPPTQILSPHSLLDIGENPGKDREIRLSLATGLNWILYSVEEA